MSGEKKQMTEAEILSQLPDGIQPRQFINPSMPQYTSANIFDQETTAQMVWRKFKENPFIPLGLGGTVFFLTRGILNMGNAKVSQNMMRGRILAQGFTVMAIVAGIAIEGIRADRKQRESNE
ncbi:HIG1 domain family member 2A, mitochondrial-like [Styela clava]|uniref:HIG1 domain family member 1A, mitochondrial-like n=1 Tax=Styela clava TaxID=7725 RepID=UPI0019397AD1|nr:HIG1 domain family member 1A, mitochondrial-like [Styela clava]